ncbi:MAG: hypothetical protein MJ188_09770 [Treponema sp.]|nr:hypothetical protein [Treponema sp.]
MSDKKNFKNTIKNNFTNNSKNKTKTSDSKSTEIKNETIETEITSGTSDKTVIASNEQVTENIESKKDNNVSKKKNKKSSSNKVLDFIQEKFNFVKTFFIKLISESKLIKKNKDDSSKEASSTQNIKSDNKKANKQNKKKDDNGEHSTKDNSYKYFFINYGYFVAIITVLFGILIYSSVLSRKIWVNGLKLTVENVLEEFEPNQWLVGANVTINNPLALNAACFEARRRLNGETYKVVIIRVQTFYGPIPAVFICDGENNVDFVGYASLHGRIKSALHNYGPDKRIEYWQLKVPVIIGTYEKKVNR